MIRNLVQKHGWWIWALTILVLTSIPGKDLPDVEVDDLDKVVHALIYFVLGYLVQLRLLLFGLQNKKFVSRIWIPAAILFGAIDELHQHFIPGRFPSWGDFIFDVIGIISAYLLFRLFRKRDESIV